MVMGEGGGEEVGFERVVEDGNVDFFVVVNGVELRLVRDMRMVEMGNGGVGG